ncbi:MAG: hypothetical protein AAB360_01005 [Patescibacteria group bacterium]
MLKPDNKYFFVLGREREIAREELRAVLRRLNFGFGDLNVTDNIAFANLDRDEAEVAKLSGILGGTTKIFRATQSKMDNEQYEQRTTDREYCSKLIAGLTAELIRRKKRGVTGKINFGISDYSKTLSKEKINTLGLEVKRALRGDLSLRFVPIREGRELSTIQSLKGDLAGRGVEVGLFDQGIGILIGLSNPEEWARRDYQKPAGDKYSGMTPPKLARMMINLALSQRPKAGSRKVEGRRPKVGGRIGTAFSLQPSACVVVDPFCGSGNILMEALMLGCDMIGSDISEKAVADSKANVDWLLEQIRNSKSEILNKSEIQNSNVKIFQADATELDFPPLFENYDHFVVVTEPYLGQPKKMKPSFNAVRGEYTKIKKLYLDFLKNLALSHFHTFTLCLVFPLVESVDRGRFSLYAESVDEIRKLGYTELRSPLVYGRDYQVVKREIVFLNFQEPNTKSQINSNSQ